MDQDSDVPLRRRDGYGLRWRREPRSEYQSFRTVERASRHPARACRLRLASRRIYDDDIMDDSDLPYNDNEEDEDDAIFSRIKPKRKFSSEPRLRRSHYQRSHSRNDAGGGDGPVVDGNVMANGVKEDQEDINERDHENDAEGEGVRRSKRQRKLLYDSFNQSWILGTQTVLRGYPAGPGMYHGTDRTQSGNVEVGNTSPGEENEENEEEGDGQEGEETKGREGEQNTEEDMYTKIKRTRRSRVRYSPSNDIEVKTRLRERRPRQAVTADSTDSASQSDSDDAVVARSRRRLRSRVVESSDEQPRVYHLRQHKPIVDRLQVSNTQRPTRRSSRLVLCSVRRRFDRKPRDSSSSDEERFQRKKALSLAKARSRCLPLNYQPSLDPKQLQKTPVHSGKTQGGQAGPKGPGDVDPMAVDTSVRFDKVGGLESHLRCLKEMVVFPMLYKDIFDKFKIQTPKGVLFHGPPGTGKTLLARALANECSQGDRKVAFFMRKGADCLSKWVGESERQLRLLFEQAYQMRPSIIFFDEIDGLAPVRSSKQDQIHASIVSTLLALLDGLDDRGDIIVIGATNRIDAIDPALRRPGRFDRELFFPLPGRREREEILQIHTRDWAQKPSAELIAHLAQHSVGYCGSDLRMLCSEAVIHALRRRYPQIYKSSKKLVLKTDQVNVQEEDFKTAHTRLVPASSRVAVCPRSRLSPALLLLLAAQFQQAVDGVFRIFPQGGLGSLNLTSNKPVYKPRYLITGPDEGYGQTKHLAPALLDVMEHIPVHIVSLSTLMDQSNRSCEEAIVQVVREAVRCPPSILYLPGVDQWWDMMSPASLHILIEKINAIPVDGPVLILATAHSPYHDLNPKIREVFRFDHLELRTPNQEERSLFLRRVLEEEPTREPPRPEPKEEEWEVLEEAPPPTPPPRSKIDMEELHNMEEHKLRELRIFLRDICAKLARNRQFFMFTKPVDVKEVPDYLNIIKQPMDLETMMRHIDLHRYSSAEEFLKDIDLIVRNALEYNPERDPEDKLIRHRACALRDTAYTLIKAEMDTDFEEECRKISKKRREEKDGEKGKEEESARMNGTATVGVPGAVKEPCEVVVLANGPTKTEPHSLSAAELRVRRRKRKSWARGMLSSRGSSSTSQSKAAVSEAESGTICSEANGSLVDGDVSTHAQKTDKSPLDSTGGKHAASSPLEKPEVKRSHRLSGSATTGGDSPTKVSPTLLDTPRKRRRQSTKKTTEEEKMALDNSKEAFVVPLEKLQALRLELEVKTEGFSVAELLDLYAALNYCVHEALDGQDSTHLMKNLEEAWLRFESLHQPEPDPEQPAQPEQPTRDKTDKLSMGI